MFYLLAIDPGIDTGWAWFSDSVLIGCGIGGPFHPEIHHYETIIERPESYSDRAKQKGDQNGLITLAIQVGRYTERHRSVHHALPKEWKGQVPKDIHNARTYINLQPSERRIVDGILCPAGKKHNVIDAIGLGKWFLALTPLQKTRYLYDPQ